MHQKLTAAQIEGVCLEAHRTAPNPPVRQVLAALRHRFGCCGRTERVGEILRRVIEANPRPLPSANIELDSLQQQLAAAEARAKRAEDLERHHQDFWAGRYQAKVTELANRTGQPVSAVIPFDDHLKLYRKAAELARRLARYEDVGSLLEGEGAQPSHST
jgi:hypothetical protein